MSGKRQAPHSADKIAATSARIWRQAATAAVLAAEHLTIAYNACFTSAACAVEHTVDLTLDADHAQLTRLLQRPTAAVHTCADTKKTIFKKFDHATALEVYDKC